MKYWGGHPDSEAKGSPKLELGRQMCGKFNNANSCDEKEQYHYRNFIPKLQKYNAFIHR
jgi:hypothetical protein